MGVLNGAIAVLAWVNTAIGWFGRCVSLTLMGLMTIIVINHIVLRLVAESPSWTEEVAIYMMIWVAFLVAPVAYRTGAFVSIEFVWELMGRRTRFVAELIFSALILGILAILLWRSFAFVELGFRRSANTFRLPLGYIYLCVPYGLITIALAALERILRGIRTFADPAWLRDPILNKRIDPHEAPITGVTVLPKE